MKPTEEIEVLAHEFYPPVTDNFICSPRLVRDAYVEGYRECEKVNSDKKYTEEDMGKMWQYVIDGAKAVMLGNGITITGFEDYIKSLNK